MAKTILKVVSTVESKLPTLPLEDGQLIFVYDKKKIILDNRGVRTVYEQIQTIETEEQRNDLLAPIDSFYFVIETSILWRYTNGHWNQITTSPQEQIDRIATEGTKQVKAVRDEGQKVLQSIPEDFTTQMETKLDKQQGIENKGKVLVIGEDGNVVPGEVQSGGGDGIAIINTMSGESPLMIPDSAERVNKGLELGGKTEQVQTSGKNLFDFSKLETGRINISTGTLEEHNHTRRLADYIDITGITSFSVYLPGYNKANGAVYVVIYYYDKDKKYLSYRACGDKQEKYENIAPVENAVYIKVTLEQNTIDNPQNIFKVQLEKGAKSTDYEPYTGGKPSPSPEYPQEIKNVGKWNDEKQKYEIEVVLSGKNLLDITACEDGKTLDANGNIVNNANALLSDFIPCFSKTSYCRVEGHFTAVSFYDVEKNKIGFINQYDPCFATPDKCRYFRFSLNKTKADYEKAVANVGTALMDYEPYKKPQTLTLTSDRPLTKWDRLVEQGGQYGWLYGGDIKTFENDVFKLYADNEKAIQYQVPFEEISNSWSELVCYCNTFENAIGQTIYIQSGKTDFYMGCVHKSMVFSAKNKQGIFQSIEAFQEWIRNSGTYVWYKTDNKKFVPLSESEQNAIRALKTYYPTTVITADGGELDPDIKVTYTADTKNYIDNKFGKTINAMQTKLLELESRV